MNITVFGTGYVGLVSGVCLASTGKKVYCIDKKEEVIDKIRQGISPIYEPGLEDLLLKHRDKITPTTDAESSIKDSQVVIIAVGTPFDGTHIDLSYIRTAARQIGKVLKEVDHYVVVTVKSTVVPGTTQNDVRRIVLEESGKSEEEIGFCMNPEFLREGNAVKDFNEPDRIVLGVDSERAEAVMRRVYDGYPDADIMVTNLSSAEMVKYTTNSLLALNISYANEIARICETLDGVDSEEVFSGVFRDKRISPVIDGKKITPVITYYLRAGCGFGGSCFPKDVKALASFAKDQKVDSHLLPGLLAINHTQLEHVFRMGTRKLGRKPESIAILGTAFKPNTDDIRESPGIYLAEMALKQGMKVKVHDYQALDNTRDHFGDQVAYFENPLEAVKDADLVYVATIWNGYSGISDDQYQAFMKQDALMLDCRSHFKDRPEQPWRLRVGVGQEKKIREQRAAKQKVKSGAIAD
ncbi:MAG: UDP-glucose dehydrogenase family protein [Cyclobacteriaceae bacterium]